MKNKTIEFNNCPYGIVDKIVFTMTTIEKTPCIQILFYQNSGDEQAVNIVTIRKVDWIDIINEANAFIISQEKEKANEKF